MISNTKDIDMVRRCSFCDVVLTADTQYASMRKSGARVCKECHKKHTTRWQKDNRARHNKTGRQWYTDRLSISINELSKKCLVCGEDLTDENTYTTQTAKGYYICKECFKRKCAERYRNDPGKMREHTEKWRKNNLGKCRATAATWRKNNPEKVYKTSVKSRRKRGSKPMGENRGCGIFLGVHVAERVLAKVFKDVERMPFGNIGFDFVCSNNKRIDVKSSCLWTNNVWGFHIAKNKIADYFVLIAFDNREDLNPLHLWMIPGHAINDRISISVAPSTVSKWDEYKLPIDRAIECCNYLR